MALDTKYRPLRYEDVLGQDASVAVLRQFVQSGTGFHQSYLFCGPHGSGKTTLGRILARALLCENPTDGNSCDECHSCKSILEKGVSECFLEMDAATKSGKDNIVSLVEDLQYSTFSGKRMLYLFDESHRLSANALDALLKPMEDVVPGSDNKQLVCIFCTTEPEKMRSTVFSRCAPAFSIRVVEPSKIAERLAWVCDQEGITYDRDVLVSIAEVTECHIRDALKTVEGVSMLGDVSRENVNRYLRLDANDTLLKVVALLGSDVGQAMTLAEEVCQTISPTSAYNRLAEVCMLAYKVHIKAAKAPLYWNPQFIEKLGEYHKDFLVAFANGFASRPGHPTSSMLAMDIARLHQMRCGVMPVPAPSPTPTPPTTTSVPTTTSTASSSPMTPTLSPNVSSEPSEGDEVPSNGTSADSSGTSELVGGKVSEDKPEENETLVGKRAAAYETEGGTYVDPRAIRQRDRDQPAEKTSTNALPPQTFRDALGNRVAELKDAGKRGSSR